MSEPSLTPMMQQYRELKARDPDALLLFRMGDFYEMFGEDAERAAALLGLTLTTRDKGPNAVPMAGFPHPALDSYLAKLVQAGQRAAVCEQVEDPKFAKGLVKREVVRVVTPGTLTDEELLDPKSANYLAAVVEVRGKLGLAWVELSTGRFSLTGVLRTELADEIARLNPAETLVSELSLDAPWVRMLRNQPSLAITTRPSWDFQAEQARTTLFEHFGTTTLAGFGVDDEAIEVQAAGALVAYLRETQKSSLGHLTRLSPYRRADTTGARRDDAAEPGADPDSPRRQARGLAAPGDRPDRHADGRPLVGRLADLAPDPPRPDRRAARGRRGALARLDFEGGTPRRAEPGVRSRAARRAGGTGRATPRDLVALGKTLALLPRIKARLTARRAQRLSELEAALELCPEIRAEIDAALVENPPLALKEGGLIRDGYHPELDELARQPAAASRGSPSIRPSRSVGPASTTSRSGSTRSSATISRSRTRRHGASRSRPTSSASRR